MLGNVRWSGTEHVDQQPKAAGDSTRNLLVERKRYIDDFSSAESSRQNRISIVGLTRIVHFDHSARSPTQPDRSAAPIVFGQCSSLALASST